MSTPARGPLPTAEEHLEAVRTALAGFASQLPVLERWGRTLARRLPAGARLLVAGNGGSAAEAQHLTAELVGRYRDDRRPFSALALNAETSSLTAILNDYGAQEVFARQVQAHGRPGDVLLLLSTSGRSPNLLQAADAGHRGGLDVWSLTGPRPNPLAAACSSAVCVEAASTATIQEVQLVAVHLLAATVDRSLALAGEDAEPAAGATTVDLRAHEVVA